MYSVFAVLSLLLIVMGHLLSSFENQYKRSVSVSFALLLIFLSIILVAYRGFGLDFSNYKDMYQQGAPLISFAALLSQEIEPGFILLMESSKAVGISFNGFYALFTSAAIAMAFISYGRKSLSVSLVFTFLIIYFLGYIDVTRAFFVSCGFIFCLYLYTEKRYFLLLVLFLSLPLIHYSFFLCWLMFFLKGIKFSSSRYVLLLFLSVVFGSAFRLVIDGINYENIEMGFFGFIETGVRYLTTYGVGPEEGFLNLTHAVSWFFLSSFIPLCAIAFNFLSMRRANFDESYRLTLMHRYSCWATLFFVFFLSSGVLVMGNRFFYLFSLGLPLVVRAIYTYSGNGNKERIYQLKFQLSVWLISFGVFVSFLYVAKAHIPGAVLYLGI